MQQLRAGDRVTFDSTVSCGQCFHCRAGRINLCDARRVLGVSCGDYRQHGAFAEYVAVPQNIVYPLPETMRFEDAALIEAVSVAVHAVNRAALRLDDSVVVVGAGMIGLLVIQAARVAGCGKLIALDLDQRRLALAASLGADEVLNAAASDAQQRVLSLTGGRGSDLAFEVVGATAPVQTAVHSLRKGGTLVLVGNLVAEGGIAIAGGRHAGADAAGELRLVRRIPGVHRPDRPRQDRRPPSRSARRCRWRKGPGGSSASTAASAG